MILEMEDLGTIFEEAGAKLEQIVIRYCHHPCHYCETLCKDAVGIGKYIWKIHKHACLIKSPERKTRNH